MKILAISFVYNEIDYLPLSVEYYRQQGCDVYVIDNMSTDGTWEWLQDQGIPSHRVDTNEEFHLERLQKELLDTVHRLKPLYFLWFSPDLFHVFEEDICDVVDDLHRQGITSVTSPCWNFKNTGEEFALPMPNHYRFAQLNGSNICLLSKYDESVKITADRIRVPAEITITKGFLFEYGACKPREVQESKLARREKAWKSGATRGHGVHYKTGKARNWLYSEYELTDVWALNIEEFLKLRIWINEIT